MSANQSNPLQPARVAIVLLNWNNAEDTLACIESLQNLTYRDFQIVVVDNCSLSSDYAVLTAGCTGKVILRQKRNRGFAGGCNVGIRWAVRNGFDYVWLLNNDTVVDPASVDELIQVMTDDPSVGMVGAVMYYWSDPERIQIAGGFIDPETSQGGMLGRNELDRGQFNGVRDVDYVSGGASLVRVKAIKEVGLLDERFFMYYEDTDWGLRMRARGWRVVTNSAAKVWHKDRASAGNKQQYFGQHGYLMFLYKNFPHHLPHALRLHARRHMRPHLQRREWKLLLADAKVYWKFISRLAFVKANLQL